ncbi:glutaredoxin [Halorubrum alkaliphilum]|uniref:Glutaredoxin n=1 Tax=Halorubrum alkaliphilum TaxID=261290 RepID=A0A8T4GES9_9EURY|nr:glutaredoxin [Halorubrum alkaliphilum]
MNDTDTAGAGEGGTGADADDQSPVSVTIYTRENCSLCVVARETIERVADDLGVAVELDLVDVDADPELAEEYGERVPYVLIDDHPAFKYEIDERELRLKLLAAS